MFVVMPNIIIKKWPLKCCYKSTCLECQYNYKPNYHNCILLNYLPNQQYCNHHCHEYLVTQKSFYCLFQYIIQLLFLKILILKVLPK